MGGVTNVAGFPLGGAEGKLNSERVAELKSSLKRYQEKSG
jgi:hypothetical protein